MVEKVDVDAKNEVESMTKLIVEAFKTVLKESQLDSEAKEVFIEKIDSIRTIIVDDKETVEEYYEGVDLTESNLENQVKINRFQFGNEVKMLNLPAMYESGAGYYIRFNVIHISPGLLQPPFFGGRRPKHQNYARLGSYIAHMIAHSLQVEIYLAFEKTKFKEKIKCVMDKYGDFSANYETILENIADIDGLRVSWRAYQNYVSQYGKEVGLKGLEQFTTEQLFFVGYAKIHCESITPEALANQIKTGPHSPAEFRVNGPLQQFDAFAKAFNCPVDVNGMNTPEKCVEW